MKKEDVVKALIYQLEKDLSVLRQAALATYDDATNEETKPENKYDTRALEASYLAGAQAGRVQDVAELLSLCKVLKVRNFAETDAIAIGALVEVESNQKTSFLFFLPQGGGAWVQHEDKKIQVITPISPLGKAFVGHFAGDEIVIETGSQKRTYEIISVI